MRVHKNKHGFGVGERGGSMGAESDKVTLEACGKKAEE